MSKILAFLALATALFAGEALAGDVTVGALKIKEPWLRATPAGAPVGAGYMTISNTGKEPDRLVGGSLPQAGSVQVHEMSMDGAIMKMRHLTKGLEIAPGATVELKPSSYHLMFMALKEPIKEGSPLKGTLVFEKAGTVEIEYKVQPIGGKAPDAAQHKHH